MNIEAACKAEVERLHGFIEAWLNGEVPADDETFSAFSDSIAGVFRMITPTGELLDREVVCARLRENHPGDDNAVPAAQRLHIWIQNLRVRFAVRSGGVCLVIYEEWQSRGGQSRGRISTAVLKPRQSGLDQLEWLHLHETWLPAPH